MGKIVNLKKKYNSIYGNPVIEKVDVSIFQYKYFTNCLKSDFCNDICCSYGADIDSDNVIRLKEHKDKLESIIGVKFENWFKSEYIIDKEFPSGKYTRTEVLYGKCVFLNKDKRGCAIHSYCLDNNIDYHILKPMVGILFPITFENGILRPSNEILDNSLICAGRGEILFDGVKEEIEYYFGKEIVRELEDIRKEITEKNFL
ncbi:MAG TPA: hypothetical protein PLE45_11150 [Spirochaetota bacterium]|nr:hypothetical protein [Spirochaetota bacterium]HPP05286.1 hypothetical protein [Spirochaetota bacterium]